MFRKWKRKFNRSFRSMSMGEAIFFMVAGLLMGTVFTFGAQYWNKAVTREECTSVQTEFLSYEKIYSGKWHHLSEIIIDCTNGERYDVDGVCLSDSFLETVYGMEDGESLSMLIHPNQNKIVELYYEGALLLDFDKTIADLGTEANQFAWLGGFLYLLALCGIYRLILYFHEEQK